MSNDSSALIIAELHAGDRVTLDFGDNHAPFDVFVKTSSSSGYVYTDRGILGGIAGSQWLELLDRNGRSQGSIGVVSIRRAQPMPALPPFSQATIDAARDWLNSSPRADEYGEADDARRAEMLVQACAEIEEGEAGERARVARQERP